jgi:hypothetical protein
VRVTVTSYPGRNGPVELYWPAEDPHSPLFGDRRRHLVITAPWRMPPAEILAAIRGQLSGAELVEVASKLGLERAQGRAEPDTTSPGSAQNT